MFSPDGRRIVTASDDRTGRVWDATTGQPLSPPLRHQGGVAWAMFSPDGRRIVTASDDRTGRVWDATTGQPLSPPLRHQGGVAWAMFSPDGRRIVTASDDRTGAGLGRDHGPADHTALETREWRRRPGGVQLLMAAASLPSLAAQTLPALHRESGILAETNSCRET